MRRWVRAVAAACAVAGAAGLTRAQFGGPTMPGGQVVGSTATLSPAGQRLPSAAPGAGMPIGSPLSRPYDPSRPMDVFKGTGIDPSTVAAPVAGFPATQARNPNLLQRLGDKLGAVVPFLRPSTPPEMPRFTPGIFRRDRERAHARNWRRD